MADLATEIAADLRASSLAAADASLALRERMTACQFSQWERAELARDRYLALMEAHLDAYMRAARRTDDMNSG